MFFNHMNIPTKDELTQPLLPLITAGITTAEEVDALVGAQLQRNAGFPITHRSQSRYDTLRGMTNLFASMKNRSIREASVI